MNVKINVTEGQNLTIAEAVKKFDLDYRIELAPVKVHVPGKDALDTEFRGIYRTDTGQVFGTVKNQYQPLQNFEMFDSLLESLSGIDHEIRAGGQGKHGAIAYLQARLKGETSVKDDKIARNLVAIARHDGGGGSALALQPTSIVCQNTFMMAYREARQTGRIVHKGDPVAKLVEIEREIKEILTGFERFTEIAAALSEIQVSRPDLQKYFKELTMTPGELKGGDPSTRVKNIRENLEGWFENSPGQELEARKGTAYGAFNAVTYWIDHKMGGADREAPKRIESAWFGTGQATKTRALKLAQEMFV